MYLPQLIPLPSQIPCYMSLCFFTFSLTLQLKSPLPSPPLSLSTMSPASAFEILSDDSDQKTSSGNQSPKETENLETIAEAWDNIDHDVSNRTTYSGISANADKKGVNFSEDNMMLPSISTGGGAEDGDSEVVPNNGNGGGGKPTSTLKPSPSLGLSENLLEVPIGSGRNGGSENGSATSMVDEAWEVLSRSFVKYKGQRVGTLAAIDTGGEALNYNQVVI